MDMKFGTPVFGTVWNESPIACTTLGKVRGFARRGIAIFKGIPYAGNADGENRFLPPVNAEPWNDVRDCTKNGYYAMQNGVSIGGDPSALAAYYKGKDVNSTGELETQGENCLVLDVLTPGLDDKKRPVVFYIHGGGFSTGSGTMVAAADPFCREEDIVVVGVNHRLNIFGYLYLGGFSSKYASSGAAGILDLVKALEWVRDNIAAFGGDPDNVTIMGESGGGMKVSILMVMQKAKGLFHKAIVESGSGPIGFNTPDKAQKCTEEILANLGIEKADWEKVLTLPAEELLRGIRTVSPMALVPVADGINIPDLSASGFTYGDAACSSQVPLLVGASEDENGLFAPIDEAMTFDTLPGKIAEMGLGGPFSKMTVPLEKAEKLTQAFCAANEKHDSAFQTFIKMSSLYGVLTGGAFAHAMERKGSSAFTAPVYHYMNAYDSARPDDIRYGFAFHTCDLPLQMRIVQRDQDDWISRIMAHAWAAFMRTGDPSTPQYPWPAFTVEKKETMIFDNNGNTRLACDPYRAIREAFQE